MFVKSLTITIAEGECSYTFNMNGIFLEFQFPEDNIHIVLEILNLYLKFSVNFAKIYRIIKRIAKGYE